MLTMTPTLTQLLIRPRSEVFAADLRRGDIIVGEMDGEPTVHQVLEASPAKPGVYVRWARCVDLRDFRDEQSRALLRRGFSVAIVEEFPRSLMRVGEESIVEIVGRNIRR